MATKPRRTKRAPRVASYLRVSTQEQNNEKFKHDIRAWANEKNLGRVEFFEEKISSKKPWKERLIAKIIDELESGDILIVPDLTRLGRSNIDLNLILIAATEKGIEAYSVKEKLHLNSKEPHIKFQMNILAAMAEFERERISQRTKEGLAEARRQGKLLGRPKGPGKSKLDPHREEIIDLLKIGVTKSKISAGFDCWIGNLNNWFYQNKITLKEIPTGREVTIGDLTKKE